MCHPLILTLVLTRIPNRTVTRGIERHYVYTYTPLYRLDMFYASTLTFSALREKDVHV